MLQLTGHDGFAVEVGNLLDLESALKRGRELEATAEQKQRLLILEHPGAEILDSGVLLEDVPDLVRDDGETLHDLQAPLGLGSTVLAERQGEHDHGDELRGVGLGGGDTDLRAGVDVDTAVGEERDGGTDNVDDADGKGTALETVPQSHEGVGRLARLRDEDASVITEDGRLTIEEIGGKLDSNGDLDELLEDSTDGHTRVVARSAGNEYYPPAPTDRADIRPETTKGHGLVGDIETATHGVDDGLGLLEDLLLHEVVELALHDLLELQLEGLDGPHVRAAIRLLKPVDVERALVDVGDVVVLEVQDLLGVLDDGRGVRRQEELGGHGHAVIRHESTGLGPVEERLVGSREARAKKSIGHLLDGDIVGGSLGGKSDVLVRVLDIDKVDLHPPLGLDTDDEGRALAGGDDLMGEVDRLDQQAIGTLELLDDGLGQLGEANVGVGVVEVLGELGNALGVGLGLELEALALQQGLQLLVVGDDTVVNNTELPAGVGPVGVAVDARGGAVRGPPGVGDAGM